MTPNLWRDHGGFDWMKCETWYGMEIKEFLPGYCRHLYVISHWGRTLVFEANSITQMIRRRIEAPNNRCWLKPYQTPIFQQLLRKLQKHPKLWSESQPQNRPFDVLHFSQITEIAIRTMSIHPVILTIFALFYYNGMFSFLFMLKSTVIPKQKQCEV